MNRLFLIVLFLFLGTSLSAYSKKIVMTTFYTQEQSDDGLKTFIRRYPSLYKLSDTNGFDYKARKSGKYYILVAEVFKDRKILNSVYKKIKQKYKSAYVGNYSPPSNPEIKTLKKVEIKENLKVKKKEIKKEVKKIEIKKNELNEQKEKKLEVIKPEIKSENKKLEIKKQKVKNVEIKKQVPEKVEVKKSKVEKVKVEKVKVEKPTPVHGFEFLTDAFEKYFQWSYVVLFVVFCVLLFYFIKFKRIYDEY